MRRRYMKPTLNAQGGSIIAKYRGNGYTMYDTSKLVGNIKMYIDGVQQPFTDYHTFSDNQDHEFVFYFSKKQNNISYLFRDCKSLIFIDLSNFDTTDVTNMEYLFYNCSSLVSLDVSTLNTSKVTDMNSMFQDCSSLTALDVSNFDTSNVTNMSYMFYYLENLLSIDLSNFDTSKVTIMKNMFYACKSITSLDLSNFDVSNVDDMSYMFYNCIKLSYLKMMGDVYKGVYMVNIFGRIQTAGTFEYDSRYDYTEIISELPSSWKAVRV